MYTTDSEPLSPTSSTSYSLITSLDALSLSAGSLPASDSIVSAPGDSRRTSSTGSHISGSSSYGGPPSSRRAGGPRLSTSSDDYEVILLPRSVPPTPRSQASSQVGQSGRQGRGKGKGKGRAKKEDEKTSSGPASSCSSEGVVERPGQPHQRGEGGSSSVGAGEKTGRKARRGGRKAKRRVENGQMRDTNAVEEALGLDPDQQDPATPGKESAHPSSTKVNAEPGDRAAHSSRKPVPRYSGSSSGYSSSSAGHPSQAPYGDAEDDEDDADEVDGMSDLDVTDSEDMTPASSPSRRPRPTETPSILSADDARSSIDDFLADPTQNFTRGDKLRLWQALCYELGLADLDTIPSLPDLPVAHPLKSKAEPPVSPSSSRSTTPTPHRPMPQSLRQAKELLQAEAHVNLADYFDARNEPPAPVTLEPDVKAGTDPRSVPDAESGRYGHLVHPSASQMRKYTKESGRYVRLEVVKAEVMQPLLRDFGFKRARQARGE